VRGASCNKDRFSGTDRSRLAVGREGDLAFIDVNSSSSAR
jgi:hypothetical protein